MKLVPHQQTHELRKVPVNYEQIISKFQWRATRKLKSLTSACDVNEVKLRSYCRMLGLKTRIRNKNIGTSVLNLSLLQTNIMNPLSKARDHQNNLSAIRINQIYTLIKQWEIETSLCL